MNVGIALGNLGFGMSEPMAPADHAELCCRIADDADRLGFHSVWVGDHVALPIEPTTPYPYGAGTLLDANVSLLDPFAIHATLAARTSRVGLGFGVVVLPYRPVLVTAKLIATIDALSAGRVILGVGAGWLPEEFAAVGADFTTRGTTTDDYLRTLLEAFGDGVVAGMTTLPKTVQRPHPPIWVGGNGAKAKRRAVELADGWDAPYADPAWLGPEIASIHEMCLAMQRDPTTLGLSVRGVLAADVDAELLGRYAELGVTDIGVILPVGDPARALDVLAELATIDGTTRESR